MRRPQPRHCRNNWGELGSEGEVLWICWWVQGKNLWLWPLKNQGGLFLPLPGLKAPRPTLIPLANRFGVGVPGAPTQALQGVGAAGMEGLLQPR